MWPLSTQLSVSSYSTAAVRTSYRKTYSDQKRRLGWNCIDCVFLLRWLILYLMCFRCSNRNVYPQALRPQRNYNAERATYNQGLRMR